MINLLEGLCWLVIEGAPRVEDVIAALPWSVAREGDRPCRLALAQTLHDSSDEDLNRDLAAVFTHGAFTFVTKPGGLTMAADSSLEAALSARFGVVWCLMSHFWGPTVTRFEQGAEVGRVDALQVRPAAGLLGLSKPLRDEDTRAVIPGAFERLVGVPWGEVFPREGATATFLRRAG